MRVIFILSLFLLLLAATSAFAYRPFNTEDAGVAGKGVLQTEISYDFLKWKGGDTDQIFLLVSPIYGPTENLELSIETPFVIHKSKDVRSEGVGDINLVGKYVLLWDRYETKDALLTMKGVVKLNSGDFNKGLGHGDTEYSLFPVVSKTIGESLTIHGQAGYTFVTDRESPSLRDYYFYGLALDLALTKPLHFVTEFTGNENPDRNLGQQNVALAGFTYEVNKQIILDATVKKGIGSASPDWGWGIGAAIEF
jgi:hypothetical protein